MSLSGHMAKSKVLAEGTPLLEKIRRGAILDRGITLVSAQR